MKVDVPSRPTIGCLSSRQGAKLQGVRRWRVDGWAKAVCCPIPPKLGHVIRRFPFKCVECAQIGPQKRPSKQKRPRRTAFNFLIFLRKSGAGEGIRTLDPNLGKVVRATSATLPRLHQLNAICAILGASDRDKSLDLRGLGLRKRL